MIFARGENHNAMRQDHGVKAEAAPNSSGKQGPCHVSAKIELAIVGTSTRPKYGEGRGPAPPAHLLATIAQFPHRRSTRLLVFGRKQDPGSGRHNGGLTVIDDNAASHGDGGLAWGGGIVARSFRGVAHSKSTQPMEGSGIYRFRLSRAKMTALTYG